MPQNTAKTIDIIDKDGLVMPVHSMARRCLNWLAKVRPGSGWWLAGVLIPGILTGAMLFYSIYQTERAQLEQGALQTARALSLAVDRDLAGIRSKLQILATAPALQTGDFREFYAQAQAFLATDSLVEAVVLIDESGQQIINTLHPYGLELAKIGLPNSLGQTFETGRPAISELYPAILSKRSLVVLEVPVWSAGKVAYALDVIVAAERLNGLLIEQELPRGWVATLLDTQGTIAASTRDAPRAVGQKAAPELLVQASLNADGVMASRTLEGAPSLVAFSRSNASNWNIAVETPHVALSAGFYRSLVLASVTMVAFLLAGVFLAIILGWRIHESMGRLNPVPEAETLGMFNAMASLPEPQEIVRLAEQFSRMQETHKNDEAQLRLSASVFSAANEGIVIADRAFQILDVNQAFTELTAYPRDEAIGQNPRFLKSDRHDPEFYAALLQTLGTTGRWQGDLWTRRKDGTVFVAYLTASAVVDEFGVVAHYVALFSDITDVQQRQDEIERVVEQRTKELAAAKLEAEHANNAKSRFLAAVSHDLRQPLAALALYVAGLDKKIGSSDPLLLANMKYCVSNLSEMLTDLMDISKLQAGAVTPNISDFSLDAMLAKTASFHAPEAQIKGIALRVRNSNLFGRTDPVLFQRIIGNFVANAIRYTEQGGVLIGCRLRQGKVWVEVWDTGIGIPADKTTEIFEEFKQLGNAERSGAKGTGLGLAIVAKTAALLDLPIRVRSCLGRGSMFAVELPLGEPVKPLVRRPNVFRPARIAIIENNSYVTAALACALSNVGHQVISASTPETIIPLLHDRRPDFVVADYRLTGHATGFNAITSLRAIYGKNLPAVIITGDTDPALIRRMARKQISVMHKPIDLDALLARIEEESLSSA